MKEEKKEEGKDVKNEQKKDEAGMDFEKQAVVPDDDSDGNNYKQLGDSNSDENEPSDDENDVGKYKGDDFDDFDDNKEVEKQEDKIARIKANFQNKIGIKPPGFMAYNFQKPKEFLNDLAELTFEDKPTQPLPPKPAEAPAQQQDSMLFNVFAQFGLDINKQESDPKHVEKQESEIKDMNIPLPNFNTVEIKVKRILDSVPDFSYLFAH